jgi:hypothetical protein
MSSPGTSIASSSRITNSPQIRGWYSSDSAQRYVTSFRYLGIVDAHHIAAHLRQYSKKHTRTPSRSLRLNSQRTRRRSCSWKEIPAWKKSKKPWQVQKLITTVKRYRRLENGWASSPPRSCSTPQFSMSLFSRIHNMLHWHGGL